MAIEVRIPKEIKEYKEKIIFGLSLRQLICVFIGGVICLATYFLTKPIVGVDMASNIIMFEAVPIFVIGFVKVRSFAFEEFAVIFIKHQLKPKKRVYETRLDLETSVKEFIKNDLAKKEVIESEFVKPSEETTRPRTIRRNEKIKTIRARIKTAKKEFKAETKRAETEEVYKSKEQLEIAKKQYQKARKRKN